jgi:hypothetical protein
MAQAAAKKSENAHFPALFFALARAVFLSRFDISMCARACLFAQEAAKAHVAGAFPAAVYLQAQRWGSALPAPANAGGRNAQGCGANTVHVLGVAYETEVPPLVDGPHPPGVLRGGGSDGVASQGVASQGVASQGVASQGAAAKDAGNEPAGAGGRDFAADDALRLYYCGDFVSTRPPGFEAAALSGAACADYIATVL